jgi:hypothetical protein
MRDRGGDPVPAGAGLGAVADAALVYCRECSAVRSEAIPSCFCGETAYDYDEPEPLTGDEAEAA